MKQIVIGLLVALAGSAVVVSAEGEQRRKIPDGLVVPVSYTHLTLPTKA